MSEIIKLGCASQNEHSQAGTVVDVGGVSFTLCAGTHGYAMGYILEVTELGKKEDIVCTVKKTSPDKKKFGAEYTRLEELGGEIAHTIITSEPCIYRENCNLVIQIERVGTVEKRLGNIYGAIGGNHAGWVYDESGIAPTLNTAGGGNRQPMVADVRVLGGFNEKTYGQQYHQGDRVYDENGVSPSMMAQPVGHTSGNSPMVVHAEAVEQVIVQKCGDRDKEGNYSVHDYSNTIPANPMSDRGQMLVEAYDVACEATENVACEATNGVAHEATNEIIKIGTLSPASHLRNGVYDPKGISPTLLAGAGAGGGNIPLTVEPTICAMRTRDKNGGWEKGGDHEQRLELNQEGLCNNLTSVQKDNLVLEAGVVDGELNKWIWEVDGVLYLIRIRKLTPNECWRLMDFTDDDFRKAETVNSNTQLYKQAGNSIVRSVLTNVFAQLF